jgi:hypothetical protein
MLRMSGRGQSRFGFAEQAERRARFALGYLVILCEGIVGFIVEFRFDHFEAYFIDSLIGSFSSKAEAANELLMHAHRVGCAH